MMRAFALSAVVAVASAQCDCSWTNGGANCGHDDKSTCFAACCHGGASPTPTPPGRTPTPSSSGWTTGTWTTGYWDCCKPSCSWAGKGNVNRPVLACSASSGEKLQDANVGSACGGGNAASCPDNQPFVVSAKLSMGFAAVAVGGQSGLRGDENCGQCYELRFTAQDHNNWGGSHPDLVGKSMIVQVTNIGYDVTGDHSFDIQIPGAGQGAFSDGCAREYPGHSVGDFDCDNHYGGCKDISGCARLPQILRPGCEWRYNWYKWFKSGGKTNNPYVDFRRVKCPQRLTAISGSTPNDDAMQSLSDVFDYSAEGSNSTVAQPDLAVVI